MGRNKSVFDALGRAIREFRRNGARRNAAGPARRRGLRIEALETRQLLSISMMGETWKTLVGTLTGTYSGNIHFTAQGLNYNDDFTNCNFQETLTLSYQDAVSTSSGEAVSTGTAHNYGAGVNTSQIPVPPGPATGAYSFTFGGQSVISDNGGQFTRSPGTTSQITRTPSSSVGGGTPYDIGISGQLVPDVGNSAQFVVNGSWSNNYTVSGYPAQTTGTYSGTLVQSGVYDSAVTTARWIPSGNLEFTLASSGPCVPVAAANRDTPIASVALYWADAQGNHLASALPPGDTVGLDWNQAGGVYQETAVSYKNPYPGATQLLIVINENNSIPGFSETNTTNNVYALSVTPPPTPASTVGLYDPSASTFYLRYANDWGAPDNIFPLGIPWPEAASAPPPGPGPWTPFAGDWNGDNVDTVGLYDPTTSWIHLRNSNSAGDHDVCFGFGAPGGGWITLVGDWDGNGTKTIGLFDPKSSTFFLRNSLTSGYADITFGYGAPGAGWQPIVADWNGDGIDTVGFFDRATFMFYLRNTNTMGMADIAFPYGAAGSNWVTVMGDWDGSGTDTIGFYLPDASHFFLRNSNTVGMADISFGVGPPGAGWLPISGAWQGVAPTSSPVAGGVAQAVGRAPLAASLAAAAPLVDTALSASSAVASTKADAVVAEAVDQIDLATVATQALESPAPQAIAPALYGSLADARLTTGLEKALTASEVEALLR